MSTARPKMKRAESGSRVSRSAGVEEATGSSRRGARGPRSPRNTGPFEAPAKEKDRAHPSFPEIAPEPPSDLTHIVGANLKRFRSERGLSLERLSKASTVSRAMLNQVELGQSTPTINVLWKVARALDVPFSALISHAAAPSTVVMPAARARVLRSRDGSFSSRALFPSDRPRLVEFYELHLAAGATENAEPHPPGTTENLVVVTGSVEISVDHELRALQAGDAILFDADVPHSYKNPGRNEAVMYLVMTYAKR